MTWYVKNVSAVSSSNCLSDDNIDEKRCGSIDIRNSPDMMYGQNGTFEKVDEIKGCTVIEGDFAISLITGNNYTDSMFLSFPHLREITGYLLVFQVNGLKSLGRMFPALRIIGGQSMLMHYSLIIYQNYDLEDVGMVNLSVIKNGGVRITQNNKLCQTRYIDWRQLAVGSVNDIRTEEEQAMGRCTTELVCDPKAQDYNCSNVGGFTSCWTKKTCQKQCDHAIYANGTAGPGCSPDGTKCHYSCLGGCSRVDDPSACHSCRRVAHNGKCVENCPEGLYELLERRCVTEQECSNVSPREGAGAKRRMWKAINGKCHYECPQGYQQDPNDPYKCEECKGYCPNICEGDKTIDTIASALELKNCDIVAGSIEIDLRVGMDVVAAEKLTEAFGRIQIIEKYLSVRFTPTFINLYMFKSLKKISGKALYNDRYALVVIENANLRQTFDYKNKTIEISNGTVMFHNNRMLCPQKIQEFVDAVNLTAKVDENDVSSLSNGERAICEDLDLEVHILDVYSYGFTLTWPPFNTTNMDHRKFLGYTIYYKKVDGRKEDMSIDDDRSACSDSWSMEFIASNENENEPANHKQNTTKNSGGFIMGSKITPDTWYAFYVQTRLVNHPGARNAISKIYFVKTSFGTPDPPRIIDAVEKSANQVVITWNPPEKPHGQITHYNIKWKKNQPMEEMLGNPCNPQYTYPKEKEHPPPKSALFPGVAKPKAEQETCAKEGCCSCEAENKSDKKPVSQLMAHVEDHEEDKLSEDTEFENKIQDKIFVQSTKQNRRRVRRQAGTKNPKQGSSQKPKITDPVKKDTLEMEEEEEEPSDFTKADPNLIEVFDVKKNITKGVYWVNSDAEMITFNMTGTMLTMNNLTHFTSYTIMIMACQNVSVKENQCSVMHDVRSVRTRSLPEKDQVDLKTLVVKNTTVQSKPFLWWKHPEDPNGAIRAYKATIGIKNFTPHVKCITKADFDNGSGIFFEGISDGRYYLDVETISMSDRPSMSVRIENAFEVKTPGFWTWKMALLVAGILLLLFIIGGIGVYFLMRSITGGPMKKYWHEQVAMNAEYLSQMELYTPDEWEIPREAVKVGEEIGRGSFGQVFRGTGNNFKTVNGIVFGDCAVKTASEKNPAQQLCFLMEGSVMKKFNTSFIVQLYGIVSDGTPVYVVMELMALGSLRDYLRAHRPGAEENIDNRPVPTNHQLFMWAAQIADGMAYLQSIKFCHRDLAARNCMVHENETVKIGDFGMARDIYYQEYYKPMGKRMMPVRWMAPESLRDGKFTMKSDVWSYGIVLYEMLTLGQQPYAGLPNDDVYEWICQMKRTMQRPTNCPDLWYNLMVKCWKYDPRDRPTFFHLVHFFRNYVSEEFIQQSVVFQDPGAFEHLFDQPYDFTFDFEEITEPINSRPIALDADVFLGENSFENSNEQSSMVANNDNSKNHTPATTNSSGADIESVKGEDDPEEDEGEMNHAFMARSDQPLINQVQDETDTL
ncbi:hypothetical protein L596_009266 [Steinernema carpocapsae]|uniref:receptor protein-tyrosine kinase n=1 Tax=Steinernema carpocapsae TaxID=34508 RepID=A0A4U5PF97_STECR|nr:hypothetical protein L596_009266 [Steinernema carpocapsae]